MSTSRAEQAIEPAAVKAHPVKVRFQREILLEETIVHPGSGTLYSVAMPWAGVYCYRAVPLDGPAVELSVTFGDCPNSRNTVVYIHCSCREFADRHGVCRHTGELRAEITARLRPTREERTARLAEIREDW